MQINRFIGKNLHGYIDVDVKFNNDLTFLYGINGCGKTTIVKLIDAMINLSFSVLSDIVFSQAILEIENNNKNITIKCDSLDGEIKISCSGTRSILSVARYQGRSATGILAIGDPKADWYANITTQTALHDVVKIVQKLPSPMFLSLERRGASSFQRLPSSMTDFDVLRYRAGTQSSSDKSALDEASTFASAAFQAAYAAESRLKSELQHDLILLSFDFETAGGGRAFNLETPSKDRALKSLGSPEKIIETLNLVGMPTEKISTNVTSFFEHLKKIIQNLPDNTQSPRTLPPREMQHYINQIMHYRLNKNQFERAERITSRVNQFNLDVQKIYNPIENFKKLVNEFLSIGGKAILLDMTGLRVNIPRIGERKIQHLSSGEQQLVVLLTHLSFNENVRRSKILIIDEPEISLHLAWQEMFVDALVRIGADLQIILATHSPSIISGRDDKSIELLVSHA